MPEPSRMLTPSERALVRQDLKDTVELARKVVLPRDIFPPYCHGCRHEEAIETRRTPAGTQFEVLHRFAQCLRGRPYGNGCRDFTESPKAVLGR